MGILEHTEGDGDVLSSGSTVPGGAAHNLERDGDGSWVVSNEVQLSSGGVGGQDDGLGSEGDTNGGLNVDGDGVRREVVSIATNTSEQSKLL